MMLLNSKKLGVCSWRRGEQLSRRVYCSLFVAGGGKKRGNKEGNKESSIHPVFLLTKAEKSLSYIVRFRRMRVRGRFFSISAEKRPACLFQSSFSRDKSW
jgi:hypothetical protein